MNSQEKNNKSLNFSERLRISVNDSGKSQAQIARDVGIKPPYLSQIINGRIGCKDIELQKKLAEATGVAPGWLITGDDSTDDVEKTKLLEEKDKFLNGIINLLPYMPTEKLLEVSEKLLKDRNLPTLQIVMEELRSRLARESEK